MIKLVNNSNGNHGNTCRCGKVMGQKELLNTVAVYYKLEGKRGAYFPTCSDKCKNEQVKELENKR